MQPWDSWINKSTNQFGTSGISSPTDPQASYNAASAARKEREGLVAALTAKSGQEINMGYKKALGLSNSGFRY